ncbi:effector-associated constant component EACC1 [Catenulispora pinisilvae]|uniref:effector-associated constant component EACC1 n=1 Tax=Catenulispora pinisilvae TaxID=2705253 RepID=UPI00189255C0|nr:hypothetical protein [Catenulispora pinisilvae]
MASLRVEVIDDDALRAERLTRALKRELDNVDGISVDYADLTSTAPSGSKGSVLSEVLDVVATWGWPLGAPLLAEAVKAWLHKEGRARVRLTVGTNSVEIDGDPTPAQERLMLAVLNGPDEQ